MVVQPTGTVTFLFTDIEGSTKRWEQAPEEMQAAVGRHDELLRSAITAHGGVVFATGGDGFAAVFARAGDALAAATEAQRALGVETWPAVAAIRVRMGLHTGEAEERAGDYFGVAVNRAARLMAVGHGGQVLVSGATVRVAGRLPPGTKLVELGSYRLKDVAELVEILQLTGDGLGEDFPPLRIVDAAVGNLPSVLTSLVGRDEELRSIEAALARNRLVTLLGPGGVGKTRLAVQVGGEVVGRYPDGVWFVDLRAVGPGEVGAAVASVLSIRVSPDRAGQVAPVVEALRGQRLLLVLDNCEHVLAEAARHAAALLAGCETVDLLATSREPLGTPSEQVLPIPVLVKDAAELFIERARLALPDFDPTAEETATIQTICRRLDGLPLGIELAARRMRSQSVDELLAGLEDRFRILRASRGRDGDHHSSMVATLDWSYDLLDGDEQLVFDRCSVFAGPFTRRAAGAVCSDGDLDAAVVGEILDTLVDKSLIVVSGRRTGATRFDLLDTMRAYGRDRLAQRGVNQTVRDRHAHWYAEHAFETGMHLWGAGEELRIAELVETMDNYRAAYHHLRATDRDQAEKLCGGLVYCTWPLVYEPMQWAVSLWDDEPGPPQATDAHLWFCATAAWGAVTLRRQDLLEAIRRHVAATGADPTHPASLEVQHAVWGARTYRPRPASLEALNAEAQQQVAYAEASGHPYARAYTAIQTAWAHDDPVEQFDRAVEIAERNHCLTLLSFALVIRSSYIEASEPDRARRDLERATEIADAAGHQFIGNLARDFTINLRTSSLTPTAKLDAADALLVTWHRAADETRVFNTLATIVTLLDPVQSSEDIILLSHAIEHRQATHRVQGVQQRVTATAATAREHLAPDRLTRLYRDAETASNVDLFERARHALVRARTAVGTAPC